MSKSQSGHIALSIGINSLRFVLALVFIYSGTVKAIDPMGTVYKMADYLTAFGFPDLLNTPQLIGAAMVLITIEYVMGVCLFFGLYRRFYLTAILIFLAVMTPLTLYLALRNPIADCGCFGDAFVLTNWQTFYKNVVLLVITIGVLSGSGYLKRLVSNEHQWLIFAVALVSVVGFMQHNLRHLPPVDFRPYSIGTDIQESMEIPEDAPQPEYETRFILEKDGATRTFSAEDYPDSTWQFVGRESVLVKPGYVPPIQDFSMTTLQGEECGQDILNNPDYTFLLISENLETVNSGTMDVINDLYDYAHAYDYPFYMVTSSSSEWIADWVERTGACYSCLQADDIFLKTMIRSNPGLLLLHDGVVEAKWSWRDFPRDYELVHPLDSHSLYPTIKGAHWKGYETLLLWLLFPLILVELFDGIKRKRNL